MSRKLNEHEEHREVIAQLRQGIEARDASIVVGDPRALSTEERSLLDSKYQKKTVVLDGNKFVLYGLPGDDQYFANINDDHEPEFFTVCRRFVVEDSVCIDIGANIGVKTLQLSRHANRGRVIAVEAGKRISECLLANVEANGLKNVDVLNAAIGDRTIEVKFHENFGLGHVSAEGTTVPMMTLDDLARRFSLDRIDFIKIDVEGYEYPILRSSLDLLNQYGSLIYFEFNSWAQVAYFDTSPKGFMDWLFNNFAYLFLVRRDARDGDLLYRYENGQVLSALDDNLFRYGCWMDMLATNCAERLNPSPRWLSEQLEHAAAARDQLRTERDSAIAARDQLRAERDSAIGEVDAIRASSSWRITDPIRRATRAIRLLK
jgi:FkbM family methyltransferase